MLALIFAYIAKKRIHESDGAVSGRAMAIAGIVLGWIGIGVLILLFAVGIGIGFPTDKAG